MPLQAGVGWVPALAVVYLSRSGRSLPLGKIAGSIQPNTSLPPASPVTNKFRNLAQPTDLQSRCGDKPHGTAHDCVSTTVDGGVVTACTSLVAFPCRTMRLESGDRNVAANLDLEEAQNVPYYNLLAVVISYDSPDSDLQLIAPGNGIILKAENHHCSLSLFRSSERCLVVSVRTRLDLGRLGR